MTAVFLTIWLGWGLTAECQGREETLVQVENSNCIALWIHSQMGQRLHFLDATDYCYLEATKTFALALSCVSTFLRGRYGNGDCNLLKLSVFQDVFACSQNTFTISQRFKCCSLDNHLLIDGERVTGSSWVGRGWTRCLLLASCSPCSVTIYSMS